MMYTSSNFENLQLIANDYNSDNRALYKPKNDNYNFKDIKKTEHKTSVDQEKNSGTNFKKELENKPTKKTNTNQDTKQKPVNKEETENETEELNVFNIENLLISQPIIESENEINLNNVPNNDLDIQQSLDQNIEIISDNQSTQEINLMTQQHNNMNNIDSSENFEQSDLILEKSDIEAININAQNDELQNNTEELIKDETEAQQTQDPALNQYTNHNIDQQNHQNHEKNHHDNKSNEEYRDENFNEISSPDNSDANENNIKLSTNLSNIKKSVKNENVKSENTNNINSSSTVLNSTINLNENKNLENISKLDNVQIQKSIANQTKTSIVECITKGQNSYEFQLNPKDLGTVKLTIDFARDKSIKINIETTTSNAIEALRQETASIENTVKELGFELNNGSLTFSFKDQSKEQQNFENNFSRQNKNQDEMIQPKIYKSKKYINILNNSNVDMIV